LPEELVMTKRCVSALAALLSAVLCVAFHSNGNAQDLERHKAAVVKILAQQEGRTRTGTGFVVKTEPDSIYIVTAAHVVEGDPAPVLEFFTARNRRVKAEVIKLEGGDPKGLALLAVRGSDRLPPDPQALAFDLTDDLQGGEGVMTIGFGRGQGDWAVLRAQVISVDGRDLKLDGRIEEGNSGGPVLRKGRVVGLITSQQGIGLATPAPFVRFVLKSWGVEVLQSTAATSREGKATPADNPPQAEVQQREASKAAVAAAPAASAAKPGDLSNNMLTWQDHSLRFVGSVREDLGYPVIRARVSDLRTGLELGTFDSPVVVDLSQAPAAVILVATFNVPGDSTTPGPHVHVSNLRFEIRSDGLAGLVQNCDLLDCYPASGTVPLN
jgi:hypothetical protein